MKTYFKFNIQARSQSFGVAVCGCVVLLVTTSAPAQNLFVGGGYDNSIHEFTPGGAESTFATGLNGAGGLAFDSAGNLFATDGAGNVLKFTPGGSESTFASGFTVPTTDGLAFQGITLPVPEPSTVGVLMVGVAAWLLRRRPRSACF